MKTTARIILLLVISLTLTFSSSIAATMNDYCVIPPFIQEIAKPNLLMIIDNSASMYDLQYVDKGKKHCSASTTPCFVDSDCATGQTCSVFDRDPFYCFDQTYSSANTYLGYFNRLQSDDTSKQYYNYNFATAEADKKFVAVSAFSCAATGAQTKKEITNELCIIYDTTRTATDQVVKFLASGNYLNWLTASKFDIEKKVLTGGRYFSSSSTLNGESRGCVGQGYIKDALTGNFLNYNKGAASTSGNTQLGVSFRVKGPPNSYNPVSPSAGGPTYIDIWASASKSYDFEICQDAITAIATGGNAEIKKTVDDCLQNTTPALGSCSVNGQACVTTNYDPANPATTTPNCYKASTAKSCSLDSEVACTTDADCSGAERLGTCSKGGGTCKAASDCSNKNAICGGYVAPSAGKGACTPGGYNFGVCNLPSGAAVVKTKVAFQQNMQECWKIRGTVQSAPDYGFSNMNTIKNQCPDIFASYMGCSNNTQKQCTVATQSADCGTGTCLSGPAAIGPGNPALLCGNQFAGAYFQQTSPYALLGTDSQLAKAQYDFCQSMNTPDATDPTDSPANSASTAGIPAILSGLAIESQLGQPISQNLRVRTDVSNAPSGLVQEYANKIRMGVMAFNNYGSAYEVTNISTLATSTDLNRVTATKVCNSTAPTAAVGTRCLNEFDCGGTASTSYCTATGNLDGAAILSLVGKGKCLTSAGTGTGTSCTKQAHCSTSGETCISDGVGDHSSGLINSIDSLRAATWTPFSEAFYNAIGYFAIDSDDSTKKTSRTDLRLNTTDFLATMNPSEYVCQANNILLITDGGSTADLHKSVTDLVDVYKTSSGNVTGSCSYFQGSQNLDDLAWLARQRNINTFSKTNANAITNTTPQKKNESINTYVVFSGADNGQTGECNNVSLLTQTAIKGGTSLLKTELPEQYEATLRTAFAAVAGGTASGTAASILSNSEGSGANILQAVFYPNKEFETVTGETNPTNASWIGEMQNLWYYVDPYIGNSSVREDTNKDSALHLIDDYVTEFQFKGGETIAVLKKDADGNGSGDSVVTTDTRVKSQGYCSTSTDTKCVTAAACPTGETCETQSIVNADDIYSLWRAGKMLWNRDITTTTGKRVLYTYLKGTVAGGKTFATDGLIDLVSGFDGLSANDKEVIQTLLQASSLDEAKNIIKYIQGYDHSDYGSTTGTFTGTIDGNKPRNRSVQIGGVKKTWKLGDIIASTPRIQSFNKLNSYHLDVPAGYSDLTYADNTTGKGYANSTAYKARGMVYAGANDGMLHAFKLGSLSINTSGLTKATLTNPPNDDGTTTALGQEQWAFIPKNVLPYLKYLADPNYSHLYLVDGPSKLLDASIGYNSTSGAAYISNGCAADSYWKCQLDSATDNNKSWRSILIGSMGVGGASAENGVSCTNCVKNPVSGAGNSSYFALDITDPKNPQYLWEFSHAELGFATSGAAVARIGYKFTSDDTTYKDTNGRWFAVVGSGPTGPIDTTYHQFKGKSDNPLRVFALDLKSGELLQKFETTINNAFAGSMTSAPIDTDRSRKTSDGFYSDDALYFGYSNCASNCSTDAPTWNGGIMRLLTDEKITPADWSLSTLISNVGPVSTAVGKLQDRRNKNLWLYTGSGRYFFKGDDSTTPGKILAVKEPCYDKVNDDMLNSEQTTTCSTAIVFSSSDFNDQTSSILNIDSTKKGWFIDLTSEDTTNNYGAERVITEPVAMPNGAIFFTSFMPSTDICNYGGKSYMWGMRYDTGGTATTSQLHGKALVQVSTGSFEEVDLATALSANFGRKMATPMIGKPPTDPPPIVSPSGNKPLKRILHIREK